MDMANISTRIRKLEGHFTVSTGLVALSTEWFAFWEARIERLVAGEAPERIGRIPIEVIDQMREQPCSGGTTVAGVLMD
jgi:hypothetical protein